MNQTLLNEFKQQLYSKGWNQNDLAAYSGIHVSDISRVFLNKKVLSFHYLNDITRAFGLPEQTYYIQYAQLCFNRNNYLDKRRSSAYIYRCAVKNYHNELDFMLTLILEERSKSVRTKNLQTLFLVSEKLFEDGYDKETIPIYQTIIDHMPDDNTEEVAISYFRKFYINRFTIDGQLAIRQVIENIGNMPEEFQEQTYLWLMATYYILKKWEDVLHYANRLEKISSSPENLGRALLYQCFALSNLGSTLEVILDRIDRYAVINDYYAELAIGNRYVALIEFGQYQYVDDYFNWLSNRDDFYIGVPKILNTFLKMDRLDDANKLIEIYNDELIKLSSSSDLYKQQLYNDYCYHYAIFLCERKDFHSGLIELINVAERSKKNCYSEKFLQSILALWKYRDYFNSEIEGKYIQMLSGTKNVDK
ncbi:helix-turn-helix domain-containing protein [Gottfriedia acidiceleris]|uniref:helix-turn-helix domain-containing protein n=1 Tax=Gottfriedia acidiceleris TaxID=371036 RepID=UPI003D1F1C98